MDSDTINHAYVLSGSWNGWKNLGDLAFVVPVDLKVLRSAPAATAHRRRTGTADWCYGFDPVPKTRLVPTVHDQSKGQQNIAKEFGR